MIENFKGKTAVLTGAGSGFGLECARIGARLGMNLVLVDVQQDALDKAAAEMSAQGVQVLARKVDVSSAEQMQALAFMAGANSIFYGEKLLTTANPQADKDMQLFKRLGIKPEEREEHADEVHQAAIEQALAEQRDSKLFYNAASA